MFTSEDREMIKEVFNLTQDEKEMIIWLQHERKNGHREIVFCDDAFPYEEIRLDFAWKMYNITAVKISIDSDRVNREITIRILN